jgi:hypothetical protein
MRIRTYAHIREGMDVLDRDGDKIGTAGEQFADCFNVDARFLGRTEYYIPFEAVSEVRGAAIYVNTDQDELDAKGWASRPSGQIRNGDE